MSTNILVKCIEELKKDEPDLSYLRGMLETLVEMQDTNHQPPFGSYDIKTGVGVRIPVETKFDDAATLDAQARAALVTIKALGGEQTE